MPRANIPLGMQIALPAASSGVAAPTSSFELPKAVGAWAWSVQEAMMQPLDATPDDVRRRHLVVGPDGDLHGVSSPDFSWFLASFGSHLGQALCFANWLRRRIVSGMA